jgi:hypothetical protein
LDKIAEVHKCCVEVVGDDSIRMTVTKLLPEKPDFPDQVVTLDREDVDVYGNVETGELLYWILGIEYGDNGIKDRFSTFRRPDYPDLDYESIMEEARETVKDLRELFDDPSS